MRKLLRRFFPTDEAATAVEYAVMLALVIAVILGSIAAVGNQTRQKWDNINNDLDAQGFGGGS